MRLYYKIRLGTLLFNDEANRAVTLHLKECLRYDILNVGLGQFEGEVRFANGVVYRFWNNNKYYAWLSEGTFSDAYTDEIIYRYTNGRPSAKMMWKFKKEIERFDSNRLRRHTQRQDLTTVYDRIQQHARDGNI